MEGIKLTAIKTLQKAIEAWKHTFPSIDHLRGLQALIGRNQISFDFPFRGVNKVFSSRLCGHHNHRTSESYGYSSERLQTSMLQHHKHELKIKLLGWCVRLSGQAGWCYPSSTTFSGLQCPSMWNDVCININDPQVLWAVVHPFFMKLLLKNPLYVQKSTC